MISSRTILLLFATCAVLASAQRRDVDIVVAGLGNAGAVACAKALEDPNNYKVTCIDAGRHIEERWPADFFGGLPPAIELGLNYLRTEKTPLGGRDLVLPFAEVLGGGSRVNGGLYQMPSERDFAQFADPRWTFDAMLPFAKALERSQDDTNSTFRGTEGPINVMTPGFNNILQGLAAAMSAEFGEPILEFANRGESTGIAAWDRNVALEDAPPTAKRTLADDLAALAEELRAKYVDTATPEQRAAMEAAAAQADVSALGQAEKRQLADLVAVRQDTWTRILEPHLDNPRLEVITDAHIIDVSVTPSGKTQFIYASGTETVKIRARKAAVLAMGVTNTPHVLQQSGIGNCDDLAAAGIECKVSVPELGHNFQDTLLTSMAFGTFALPAGGEPGSILGMNHRTAGSDAANVEDAAIVFPNVIPVPVEVAPGVTQTVFFPLTFFQLGHIVHSNRGSVLPISNDPHGPYRVFSDMYADAPEEMAIFVENFRRMRTTVTNLGYHIELAPGYDRLAADATDAEIATYIQDFTSLGIHGVGTCAMGKVVDGNLRLLNADSAQIGNLYVADNSILPGLLETHSTSKMAMIIGARGMDLILADVAN